MDSFESASAGKAEAARWHTGQGYAAIKRVSVEYKGWTYGARASVPWVDAAGS